LREDFSNGAVGIKVWKDIGMKIKNKDGAYIQIDDPMFEPILRFIAEQDKTLIAQMGSMSYDVNEVIFHQIPGQDLVWYGS
jgi:hypothetical protein